MTEENFHAYRFRNRDDRDEFFRELRTFHNQTSASRVVIILSDAECRVNYAMTRGQIDDIIDQTQQKMALIAAKCNLHDASRVNYLMSTFGGQARTWFSKKS